jgi:long-chain-fatty-acid--[acyl-carrier-protein] ligase
MELRWKIAVNNIDCLKKIAEEKKGVLLISNHSSNLDGNLIYKGLGEHGYFINIWAHDFVYKLPIIGMGISSIGNVKIPNVSNRRNCQDVKKMHKAILRTIDGLKKGRHYMFFPSGHSKKRPNEEIRGKSALHHLLQIDPNLNIILVKHKGMWGSRFSWAYERPKHCKSEAQKWMIILKDYCKMFVGNLFLFIPKRKFEVNLEVAPNDFPRFGTRREINTWLERYFNEEYPEGEPINVVNDYFWQNKGIRHSMHSKKYQFEIAKVPKEVRNKVIEVIARKARLPSEEIHDTDSLEKDLHLDSFEVISILCELEKELNHPKLIIPSSVTSVGHLMALLSNIPIEVKHEFIPFKQLPASDLKPRKYSLLSILHDLQS